MRLRLKRPSGGFKSLRSRPLAFLRLAAKRRRRFPLFPLRKPVKVYGRIGSLEVRLARSGADIKKAQRLRFEVFYREMAAIPDARTLLKKRDEDDYDAICDHLLVIDKSVERSGKRPLLRRSKVVGTYRVLLQDIAEKNQGFYTQGEYDIAPLIARQARRNYFLELGRSCVLKPYRNRAHRGAALARPMDLYPRAWRGCHARMCELPGHRPEGARPGLELPSSLFARARGLARLRASGAEGRHEHDAQGGSEC